ncbi:MAG: hypothetical protein DRJ03_10310 [Chloroflexi bacterium]|nr:MAG: hypothetical protein DRJ03_10310 [Chloroflexota bacterium]
MCFEGIGKGGASPPLLEFTPGRSAGAMIQVFQQFPLWEKSQIVAAISQSRRTLYAAKYTRFPNRGYKTGIAAGFLRLGELETV